MDYLAKEVEATVHLTPLNHREDDCLERCIVLTKDKPVARIGRSSKRRPSLEPSPTNGFFDCPVMSREHAELHLDYQKQIVQIQDTASLHGTFLNDRKLTKLDLKNLKTGDNVAFGVVIDRGFEKFTPYKVRADVDWSSTDASQAPKVYRVPDDTDVEDASDKEDAVREMPYVQRVLKDNGLKPVVYTYPYYDLTNPRLPPISSFDNPGSVAVDLVSRENSPARPSVHDVPEEEPESSTCGNRPQTPVSEHIAARPADSTTKVTSDPPMEEEAVSDDNVVDAVGDVDAGAQVESEGPQDDEASIIFSSSSASAGDEEQSSEDEEVSGDEAVYPHGHWTSFDAQDEDEDEEDNLEYAPDADFDDDLSFSGLEELFSRSGDPSHDNLDNVDLPVETGLEKAQLPAEASSPPAVQELLVRDAAELGSRTGKPEYFVARELNKAALGFPRQPHPRRLHEGAQKATRDTSSGQVDDVRPELNQNVNVVKSDLTKAGDEFLLSPLQGFRTAPMAQQDRPMLDETSAYCFDVSKRAAADQSAPLEQTGIDKGEELLSKRKADQISQASPQEEANMRPHDAHLSPARQWRTVIRANKAKSMAYSDSHHELPRPTKRLRHVAEAVGYAAIGGIAVLSALIATAPEL